MGDALADPECPEGQMGGPGWQVLDMEIGGSSDEGDGGLAAGAQH